MRENSEKMRKAEKEIGENIPDEMIGLDTEDVGPIEKHEHTPKKHTDETARKT